MMAYLSLFVAAFLAATLLPLSSEALLATLIYQHYSLPLLWAVATLGNTLGSCVNWYLGKQCLHLQTKKWFPFSQAQINNAQTRFKKHGQWSLLFAWVPVIGDPLTFFAGVMRVSFYRFLVLVFCGKAIRYLLIIGVAIGVFGNGTT
nr:YqaA family protein [Cellvibrio mixtus]